MKNPDAHRAVLQIERAVGRRLPELEKFTRESEMSPALVRELQFMVNYVDQAISAAKRQGQQDLMRGRLR